MGFSPRLSSPRLISSGYLSRHQGVRGAVLAVGLGACLALTACNDQSLTPNKAQVTALAVIPNKVVGGQVNSTGDVKIQFAPDTPPDTDIVVDLTSSDRQHASVPANVTISSSGGDSAIFTVTTSAVTATTNMQICGNVGTTQQVCATLTVNPSTGATPSLSITKSHTGNFTQGANGQYTVTVSSSPTGGSTSGTVTVTENPDVGETLVSMTGNNWTCAAGGNTCTRSDVLSPGSSYDPITVTVSVAANAASPQVNKVTVSGGGSPDANAQDSTTIQPPGNQVPTISSISPGGAPVGSGDTSIQILGTNFNADASEVNFGPASLAINSISPTQITATIPAKLLIASAGVNVTVTNAPPGGGTSNTEEFTIEPSFIQGSTILNPGNIPAIDDAGDIVVAANGAIASVYVFNAANNQWTLAAVLNNPDTTSFPAPRGAVSAAISGDGSTIVLGSCDDNTCVGHAFVYEMPSGGWSSAPNPMSPTAQLQPSNDASSLRVGHSVAIDQFGGTIAVGAPCDYTAGVTLCGYVYVWLIPGNGHWVNSNQETALLTDGTEATVGFSLAMDWQGQTIVIGVPGIANADDAGQVDVFVQAPGTWHTTNSPSAKLAAVNASKRDQVGWSVAVSTDGNTIVTGAPQHPADCSQNPCIPGPGGAFVFANANGWLQVAELIDTEGQNGDRVGSSVALNDGGTVIVVAPFVANAFERGSTYIWNYRGLDQQTPFQWPIPGPGVDQSGQTVFPLNGVGGPVAITRPLHIGGAFGQYTTITAVMGDFADVGGKQMPVTFIFNPK